MDLGHGRIVNMVRENLFVQAALRRWPLHIIKLLLITSEGSGDENVEFRCSSLSLSVVLSFFSLSFMFFLCHKNHQKAFATIGCNLRLWKMKMR